MDRINIIIFTRLNKGKKLLNDNERIVLTKTSFIVYFSDLKQKNIIQFGKKDNICILLEEFNFIKVNCIIIF